MAVNDNTMIALLTCFTVSSWRHKRMGLYVTKNNWRIDPLLYCGIRNLHFCFKQLYLLRRQPCQVHDRVFVHALCQHLPGNLKASLVHAFFHTFYSSFLSSFFSSFLVAVIYEGSFNAYRIPELVVGSEFGIREAGNLQLLYGFSYLRVIKQVGWNLPRIGSDFRQETEPQHHHALISNGMRSELREFNEGEMQAFDDLIAVLIMHDAVVVDEIRSIMRKDTTFFDISSVVCILF